MKNPYEVLGVPENATDEQIKYAYKELAKKYSQNNYSSGPLSDIAQKKMQELDEAYDTIIMNRQGGYSSERTYGEQTNNNYSSHYTPHSDYSDIRATIQNGRIDDAQTLLDGIPPAMRDAEWYFLKGTVQHRRGWLEEAVKNYQTACNMDPNNGEYNAAFNSLNNSRSGGFRTERTTDKDGCCDICTGLLCADCCCECFGGDLIPCC